MEGPTQGFGLVLRRKSSGSEIVSHQSIDIRAAVESKSDYFPDSFHYGRLKSPL